MNEYRQAESIQATVCERVKQVAARNRASFKSRSYLHNMPFSHLSLIDPDYASVPAPSDSEFSLTSSSYCKLIITSAGNTMCQTQHLHLGIKCRLKPSLRMCSSSHKTPTRQPPRGLPSSIFQMFFPKGKENPIINNPFQISSRI